MERKLWLVLIISTNKNILQQTTFRYKVTTITQLSIVSTPSNTTRCDYDSASYSSSKSTGVIVVGQNKFKDD